jgi:hypothetical protein
VRGGNATEGPRELGASRAADSADDGPAADGVDRSLILWMLSLTPAERLDALQGFVDSTLSLRDGPDRP